MPRVSTFLQRYANVFTENRILKFCCLVLLLFSVVNSVALHRVAKRLRTIIIPAASGEQFEFTDDTANELYLRRMARYILDLRANITPSNVQVKFNELLSLVCPKQYGIFRERLGEIATDFKKHSYISQYLIIDEEQPIKVIDGQTMLVRATKYRLAGKEVVRQGQVHYRIGYRIDHGRFYLTALQEQEKGEERNAG